MPGEMPFPAYDVDFAVPFRHRLRFTRDVLGRDKDMLLNVLEPTDGPVRALFVVDDGLLRAQPGLMQRIAALCKDSRVRVLSPVMPIHGGEACKNDPAVVDALLDRFNAEGLDRRNYVIVIGGGAVLDAVGYAAAIAHRGLRLVRLPATTLAQADSGVGVKNAINRFGKKNWQGTFAVPWAVINDEALLSTLPDLEFFSGFSEAVKVALLKEPAFFDRLCSDAGRIASRDPQTCRYAIERSAWWHLQHITRGGDPFEMLEARPLDFGHWSAHRLEAMSGFSICHGEAVAIGLAIDCVYSSLVLGFPEKATRRVIGCLQQMGIVLSHPLLLREEDLLRGVEEFRQHLGGRLTLTMLRDVGSPVDVHELDVKAAREAISRVQREGRRR